MKKPYEYDQIKVKNKKGKYGAKKFTNTMYDVSKHKSETEHKIFDNSPVNKGRTR